MVEKIVERGEIRKDGYLLLFRHFKARDVKYWVTLGEGERLISQIFWSLNKDPNVDSSMLMEKAERN